MKRLALSGLILLALVFSLSISPVGQEKHKPELITIENADGSITSYYGIDPDYYTLVGDGDVSIGDTNPGAWNTVHDATTADAAAYVPTTCGAIARKLNDTPQYGISRAFLPIDTSTLPSDATVTAATFYFYCTTKLDEDDDAYGYVKLVGPTSQANTTTLATSDFDNCAAVDNPALVSGALDITNVTTSAWNSMALTDLTVITKAGTLLGMREGHDIEDSAPDGAGLKRNRVTFGNYGYTYPPYLAVTYTVRPKVIIISERLNEALRLVRPGAALN